MNKIIPLIAFSVLLLAPAGMQQAFAGGGEFCAVQFDTELVSLDLTGGPYPMPLASDPGNLLGDSIDGYGFVDSLVTITVSSAIPSTGEAFAFPGFGLESIELPVAETFSYIIPSAYAGEFPLCDPLEPEVFDGQQFTVDSFFDVFFDITVTDVDPRQGRDFAGMPDGASIQIPNNGPANMESFYDRTFDMDAPNYGLIPPPEVAPYIGHFNIEIPLNGDINGNANPDGTCIADPALSCLDKIKFTIASHAAGDENRVFTTLPDGTVIDEFDSAAFLEGAVVDEWQDPPFTLGAGSPGAPAFSGPGALTGPTTATSTLINPLLATIIGGEIIPIASTSLILAGAQTFSWILPVVLSVLGIGLFVVSRKSENS